MERGLVVPTVVRLAELALLFDCDIAELLRESNNLPQEQSLVLMQQLGQLNYDDRVLVLELVDRLSARLAGKSGVWVYCMATSS